MYPLSSSPFPEPSCQQDSICSVIHFVIACATNMVRDESTDAKRTSIELYNIYIYILYITLIFGRLARPTSPLDFQQMRGGVQ